MSKTHFTPSPTDRHAVCGQLADLTRVSDDPMTTTCERCRASYPWRRARVRLVLPEVVR